MKNSNKKGFTLVELSIVLVIIGLLIGGILVGQSLIESAKMQSFIRQIGQYDAAIAVFKDKFGNLPGDNELFNTTANGRLANGTIQDDDAAVLLFSGEISGFWSDLSASGLKNEEASTFRVDATPTAHTDAVIGTDIPLAKIGTNAGIYTFGLSGSNYYWIASDNTGTASAAITTTLAVKPADALAVDSKLDDGDGDAGNVIGDSDVGGFDTAATPTTTDTTCIDANGVYAVATTTDTCMVRIRIGTSTGVLN